MVVAHPHCPPISDLVALLAWRAAHQGDRVAYRFLDDAEHTLTWAQLDSAASAVAATVQQFTKPGDRVLLIIPEGLDFLVALLGCMKAGALAVPVHPPDPRRLDRTLPRLQNIAADAGIALVLTDAAVLHGRSAIVDLTPALAAAPWCDIAAVDPAAAHHAVTPPITPNTLAYLQYTSGSTSTPKGVIIDHHNLLWQLTDFDRGYDHTPSSVIVSWLPATHDLGLVYGRLMALFIGCTCVFFAPGAFMQRPSRWLRALSDFAGTHTCAPNFGYELAAKRVTDDELVGVDLSALRVALNGAEPIKQASERSFQDRFAPFGLSPTALTHAMGMSEATAKILTEPVSRTPPKFLSVDPVAYEQNRVVVVPDNTPGALQIASNGFTSGDTEVVIAHPIDHTDLGDDTVGEMWVRGQTVARGYWNLAEATSATFGAQLADGRGPFLRTGDLAFRHDGEVYLGGRLKDLLIIRGQNHHPQDLEWSVEAASPAALRPNCVIAVAVPGPDGHEGVAIIAEAWPEHLPDQAATFAATRAALAEHGLAAEHIALIAPRAIPKTSSGKLQRSEARRRLVAGDLAPLAEWRRHVTAPAVATTADVLDQLTALTAALVGLPADALDLDVPVRDLGLDSVTAVDLLDRLGRALGRPISASLLYDHPTLAGLAAALTAGSPAAPAAATAAPAAGRTAADIAAMSEADVEAALLAELDDL